MGISKHLVTACFSIALVFFSGASIGKESQDRVEDVKNLPTMADAESGMELAYLAEDLKQLDVFVAKLGPAKQSNARKHLYEQLIYVIEGKGYTLIWKNEKSDPVRLDWEAGDLFSTPVNFRYQHHNGSSTQQAVLYHVTTKPLLAIMLGDKLAANIETDYADQTIWDEYYPIKEPIPTGTETEAYVEVKGGFIVKSIDKMKLPFNRPGHFGIAFLPLPGNSMAGNHLFELQIFDMEPPTESPYNQHPWEVVYYVLDGNGGGLFHMEDEPPEYLEFKKGDVFFEKSNKWHWHAPLKGSKYRIIQIKASGWFHDSIGFYGGYSRKEKPASFDEFFDQISKRAR